jgi:hypothetical protein
VDLFSSEGSIIQKLRVKHLHHVTVGGKLSFLNNLAGGFESELKRPRDFSEKAWEWKWK